VVSEEKLRLMIKLNQQENDNSKESIKEYSKGRFVYVGTHTLFNFVCNTLAYLLILLIFIIYRSQYLFTQNFLSNYMRYATMAFVPYVIFALSTVIISIIHYYRKYDRIGITLKGYMDCLNELEDYYETKGENE
jgi:hypothetical protein